MEGADEGVEEFAQPFHKGEGAAWKLVGLC